MKKFNTTAACIPSMHYMVDLSDRISQIKKMVDAGEYFTINRARQYGKTTTLNALAKALEGEYIVVSLDFQELGTEAFRSEGAFVKALARTLIDAKEFNQAPIEDIWIHSFEELAETPEHTIMLDYIFRIFKRWCKSSEKPVVLMIDEIDRATNNQVFLDFLAQLRTGYITRNTNGAPAFLSVVLVGVTDIKYLKSKIRGDDSSKVNSPWNIATDFKIDMSLSQQGIEGMLMEYESDHHTGMDTSALARLLRDYTGGYPFLVSRICQLIDQDVSDMLKTAHAAWTKSGFLEAVKRILSEKNPLFESLIGKLTNYPELRQILKQTLIEGVRIQYNPLQDSISQMEMYGFIKNENQVVTVSNRIFETLLYNLFLSDEELKSNVFGRESDLAKNIFVKNGHLDLPMIL